MPAPPFVPLPSGNNPAVGAAAGAAQSASSAYLAGLQFATALRNFNAQQQQQAYQQQQQQAKAAMDRHLQMVKEGYTPADSVTHGTPSTASTPGTFSRRDAKPGVDPSQIVTDEFGRRWVSPPATPDATPQQTYTDLQSALEKGGQTVSPQGNVHQMTTTPRVSVDMQGNQTDTGRTGVNVPVPDPSRVVTPPGSKQGIYMPTGDEQAASTLQQRLAAEAAGDEPQDIDTEHFSQPVMIGRRSGTATPITLPEGVTHNEKAATEPNQSTVTGYTGPKGGPLVRDPKTGKTVELDLPPGSRRVPTEGQLQREADLNSRAKERAQDRNDAMIEKLQAQADKLDTLSAGHRQRAGAYHSKLATENGELVGDPEGKSDVRVPMDPQLRTRMAQKFMDAKTQADAIDKQAATLKQEIAKRKAKFPETDTAPAAPAQAAPTGQARPAQPAAAAGAPRQPKVATIEHVRSYAQQKGISEAAAIKEFQGYGYKIGQ